MQSARKFDPFKTPASVRDKKRTPGTKLIKVFPKLEEESSVDFDIDTQYTNYLWASYQCEVLKLDFQKKQKTLNSILPLVYETYKIVLENNTTLNCSLILLKKYRDIIPVIDERCEILSKVICHMNDQQYIQHVLRVFNSLSQKVNELKLKNISSEEIKKCFVDNLLGADSELCELIEKVHAEVLKHKEFISKLAATSKSVCAMLLANEDSKVRCGQKLTERLDRSLKSSAEDLYHLSLRSAEMAKNVERKMQGNISTPSTS